jgi:hypothetical protein
MPVTPIDSLVKKPWLCLSWGELQAETESEITAIKGQAVQIKILPTKVLRKET